MDRPTDTHANAPAPCDIYGRKKTRCLKEFTDQHWDLELDAKLKSWRFQTLPKLRSTAGVIWNSRLKPNHTGFWRKQKLDEDLVREGDSRLQEWATTGREQSHRMPDSELKCMPNKFYCFLSFGQVNSRKLSPMGESSDSKNDLLQTSGHLATCVLATHLSQS